MLPVPEVAEVGELVVKIADRTLCGSSSTILSGLVEAHSL
jgi:hypothetical protein